MMVYYQLDFNPRLPTDLFLYGEVPAVNKP